MANIAEIEKTMRVITDIHARYNVDIHFGHGPCCTNGKSIYINAGNPEDEVWRRLVEAKITHEAGGHIRHTDFGVASRELRNVSSTFAGINNIIEDCRVETACMNEFSGAYWVFRSMTYDLIEEGYFQIPDENTPPDGLLFAWLLYSGRGIAVDGQEHLKEHGDFCRVQLENQGLPSNLFDEIEERMPTWANLKDTMASIEETKEVMTILKRLHQYQPQQPPQMQQQQGDSSDDQDEQQQSDQSQSGNDSDSGNDAEDQNSSSGSKADSQDDSDDDADGNGNSGSDGDSDDDADGNGDTGASGDSDDDSDGNGNSGADGDSDDDADGNVSANATGAGSGVDNPLSELNFQDMGDGYQDMHDVIDQAINDRAVADPATSDQVRSYNPVIEVDKGSCSSLLRQRISEDSRSIRRIIESQMWAKEAQPVLYDDSGSEFDNDLLAGVLAGNNRIFYTEDIVETYKSSFIIAVDFSGSMCKDAEWISETKYLDRLFIAQQAALSIATSLEDLDVPVAIIYFDDEAYMGKSFMQQMNDVLNRVQLAPSGTTKTDTAIRVARTEFMKLEGIDRKQLLVITDGAPDNMTLVQDQVALCSQEGIDVASIQIQESKYGGIDDYKVLKDAKELPQVLEDIVRENMLDSICIN